jgi:UDP-N-acetylglucosamine diphosphorylase / glucose-1-phosphate thymidylyltransferase / UDP-N-acetylgalactosamine diphosphorylase / glucosamine-1-phosphate N-acetyltransferase / galactosamine-1-phosphate N-acetyltransferase
MRTTQAVILARGLGSRMRAAVAASSTPAQQAAAAQGAKGMMPFARPFLDYSLAALADAGIHDAVLVVAPEEQPGVREMREYFLRTAAGRRVAIRFAVQREPLGTADAVAAAAGAVEDAPFLVLNSDNLYPTPDMAALAELGTTGLVAYEADSLVARSGLERERVLKFALLDLDATDHLRAIHEKPAADDPLAQRAERWVSMNLWSFTPAIFAACARVQPSPRGELELQDAVTLAMAEGMPFRVVRSHEGVLDLSSRLDIENVGRRLEALDPRP